MKWQEAHVKARVLSHRFTCTLLMSLSHALAALQPATSLRRRCYKSSAASLYLEIHSGSWTFICATIFNYHSDVFNNNANIPTPHSNTLPIVSSWKLPHSRQAPRHPSLAANRLDYPTSLRRCPCTTFDDGPEPVALVRFEHDAACNECAA